MPGNSIARQIYLSRPSQNGPNLSADVIPAAPSLLHEHGAAHLENPSALSLSDEISSFMYPIMPVRIPRYKRERTIDPRTAQCELLPVQRSFSLGDLPNGWVQLTHPEGQPFFYHIVKRIITEAWIWDQNQAIALDKFIARIEHFTQSRNVHRPDDVDLVLEISQQDEDFWCGYYYVCHSTRSLFWLEKHTITDYLSEVRGELHPTHIKLYLEHQYWFHWDLFPNVNKPTTEILHLVATTIEDAWTDVLTSEQSTVNLTRETLKDMADIIEHAARRTKDARVDKSTGWCIGRFMTMLTRDRFLNFHGQYGARLNRSQSIHSDRHPPRSWLIITLSPLLFAAPGAHFKMMKKFRVDGLTVTAHWAEFFSSLNKQWAEYITHASILLIANVFFLVVLSAELPISTENTIPKRSSQIACYLSVMASFGSMVIGLLLVRQHNTKKSTEKIQNLSRMANSFEALAIMYSLPYALLMWGMTAFLLAFILMIFTMSVVWARAVVGASTAVVCLFIAWCTWMMQEGAGFNYRYWARHSLLWIRSQENNNPVVVGPLQRTTPGPYWRRTRRARTDVRGTVV